MNKLKTSTKVLIALAVTALVLSVVLLITIPEPWAESIKEHHALIMDGSFHNLDEGEQFRTFHGFNKFDHYRGKPLGGRSPFHFGGFLLFLLILFAVFRKTGLNGFGRGRRDHSRSIVDQLYAEDKISEEEYRRRRTVIEEEDK